jgi:hypothetical protein
VLALAFDDFGWTEVQREAEAAGCSEEELIREAIVDYVAALQNGGGPPPPPDVSRMPGWRRKRRIEIELSAREEDALASEARRQEVPPVRLAEHAVIVRLA